MRHHRDTIEWWNPRFLARQAKNSEIRCRASLRGDVAQAISLCSSKTSPETIYFFLLILSCTIIPLCRRKPDLFKKSHAKVIWPERCPGVCATSHYSHEIPLSQASNPGIAIEKVGTGWARRCAVDPGNVMRCDQICVYSSVLEV